MKIDILTIFPEIFKSPFSYSIIKRAIEKKLIEIKIHNLRDYSEDKHKKVDDVPYGGKPGMVIMAQPVYSALDKIMRKNIKKTLVIYPSPQGKLFNHEIAKKISGYEHLIFICGHYEGIDERIMKRVDMEISIGDYVLTGGELPAMVMIDCIARFIPGVIKENKSVVNDSFYNGLLDYPVWTRPKVFRKMEVPEVLLSGHHKKIEEWKIKESLRNTYLKRPDLLEKIKLTPKQKNLLKEIEKEIPK